MSQYPPIDSLGVFLEQIEYLLVVSTPLEITLLGIAFAESKTMNCPRGSLTIYRTEMSCHADNVNMSSIVGTKTGRIFMRGNDGQLFELLYQVSLIENFILIIVGSRRLVDEKGQKS